MNEDNLMMHLPFDEQDNSSVAYDYSKNRNDGVVLGAAFASGHTGKALKGYGNGFCEISQDVIPDLASNFTIVAYVKNGEAVVGSPNRLIWCLNYFGEYNYEEVEIPVNPGTWHSIAVVSEYSEEDDIQTFIFYVDGVRVKTIINATETLVGLSLNQDYYGGDYLYGLLDDVWVFDCALSLAEINSIQQPRISTQYLVDGVDFKDFGVYVSASDGILDRPKMKDPFTISSDYMHGERTFLNHKYLESREITLSCFIKAESRGEFVDKVRAFGQAWDSRGKNRLVINVVPDKPLIYEVYVKDAIRISKEWSANLMVGTFTLNLIEPEPVKRVLKHFRNGESTKRVSITMTTRKDVNIYWGDGSVSEDVCGSNLTITHDYTDNGSYYPVITGCIEEITDFETNAIVVFTKI